jgi:hypothetical protein
LLLNRWKAIAKFLKSASTGGSSTNSTDQQETPTFIMSDPNPNGGDLFDMAKDGTKGMPSSSQASVQSVLT